MAGQAEKRALDLRTYADVIVEIERIEAGAYDQSGNWNLSQVCEHCGILMRGTLEGFEVRVPWLVRVTLGKWFKRQWIARRKMARGGPTLKQFLPRAAADDPKPIEDAKAMLRSLARGVGGVASIAFAGGIERGGVGGDAYGAFQPSLGVSDSAGGLVSI